MGNLKIILGMSALVIISGGALLIVLNDPNISSTQALIADGQIISPTVITPSPAAPASKPTPTPSPAPISTPTPAPIGFTMSQVAQHNSAQDCWTAISGNVYNLTSWIKQHPGGSSAIISLCGINGTSAFFKQHEGQKRPEAQLIKLLIGELK